MSRLFWFLLFVAFLWTVACGGKPKYHGQVDIEDNDFAEFEDFDDDIAADADIDEDQRAQEVLKQAKVETKFSAEDDKEFDTEGFDELDDDFSDSDGDIDDVEATIEVEEDSEFDSEGGDQWPSDEFESDDDSAASGGEKKRGGRSKPPAQGKQSGARGQRPDLEITNVPLHLRTQWDSFYVEILMLAGLGVYFLNFMACKTKNYKLASAWFDAHRDLLEANFSHVGDDGTGDTFTEGGGTLMRDAEHQYSLWCSGRVCCEGMLVHLKLLKRQDLVSTISRMLQPAQDQLYVKVEVSADEMDTFVFCVGKRSTVTKLHKSTMDLSTFCSERRAGDKLALPSSFLLLSEVGEVAASLLDTKVVKIFEQYESMIDYIHISDQFSGPKSPEDSQPSKLPVVEQVMIFNFNIPSESSKPVDEVMRSMRPLLQMVFYMMDKVRRFRLSKEGKQKCYSNRKQVEEQFVKLTHAQRVEAAQQRREDKRRAAKEKIMCEEDPDKQRKWEEREHKRDMKKRNPVKMKQMKVRAM